MIRKEKYDPFFHRQPEREFVKLFAEPLHAACPPFFGKREIEEGEICADKMYLTGEFPDPDGVLETAYADFSRFLQVYKMAGDRYPVRLVHGKTRCFEAYTLQITEEGITLTAEDTEGIRRGLIYIEDLLTKKEGPFLTPGKTERWPHIRARISRSFFSPTNRPPKNGDELSDDVDYYPEEYLNRLAHDGTNGVWIYTSFKAILPPGMVKEYGDGYAKRIEKLRDVIRRCARYGVKVYVFAIEPMAFPEWEMLNKYPQVWGASTWDDKKCFCTNTEFGRNYCIDSTKTMCELLPGLGGYISITNGERSTSCASGASDTGSTDCPHCKGKKVGEILSQAVDSLMEGIRQSGKDVPFLSWTYGHRSWKEEDIEDYVRTAPSDVCLMQNFDDMGIVNQLGKNRVGPDYWLSYAGPSDLFRKTALAAKKYGKIMYAKTQVCTSHEVATVPYIPTPGLIFDKWKGMHELGVTGVMECWYFGNYPSLMAKAAGELSFCHDFSDEKAFLEDFAGCFWGRSRAKTIAEVWAQFKNGYTKYPQNIMYSYYGPMHDGITWQLQLEPKNFSMPRSWYSTDMPDGDRFDECMQGGHNAEEIEILTGQMTESWKKGMALLDTIPDEEYYITWEQKSVARALDILFESGHNISKFYMLREKLGQKKGNPGEILDEMQRLVKEEIRLSHEMAAVNDKDSRLGYHSEAENYKFFPEKIRARIPGLEALLETEFPKVRERIEKGLSPLAYYDGEEEGIPHYTMGREGLEKACWVDLLDGTTRFRVAYDEKNLYMEFEGKEKKIIHISPEFTLLHNDPAVLVHPDGTVQSGWVNNMYHSMCIENRLEEYRVLWQVETKPAEGFHYTITLSREKIGWTENVPMKLRIGEGIRATTPPLWCVEDDPVRTLGKNEVSPGEYGWLMP